MVDTELQPSIEGTMQGGPLSPLLANILLDDFDKELESRGLHFVRYADDFLVFTKTSEAAQRVARSIENYLTRKLRLVVNHQKSRICGTDGVEFLGFSFVGYGGNFRVSLKNQQKFKDRVREITRRNRGVSMSHRLLELRRYFQGWVGYFSLVPMKTYFQDLDKWVRRRIRSCYWKHWRNPRTRIRNLRQLGVRRDQAMTHGYSSKGPWVMSSSQAVHEALSITVPAAPGTSATGPHVAGIGESVNYLAKAHCEEMNRPVRTRMPGGVGGASEQSGSLSRCTPNMGVNLWGEVVRRTASPLYENGTQQGGSMPNVSF